MEEYNGEYEEDPLKDYEEGGKFNNTPAPSNIDNSKSGVFLGVFILLIIISLLTT